MTRDLTTWRTSVDELLLIFRDSLRGLAPIVQRAHIETEDGSSYDDWDKISTVLFSEIVERSLRWSLSEPDRDLFRLPAYGMWVDGYADTSFVALESEAVLTAFVRFSSNLEPFDSVIARPLDPATGLAGRERFLRSVGGVRFALAHRRSPGADVVRLTALDVSL